MSEADNAWRVDLSGQRHEVEVEHSTMTGRIHVRLDGRVVDEDRLLLRDRSIDLEVDGHRLRVDVDFANAGFSARSSLHVDDRYIEPLSR